MTEQGRAEFDAEAPLRPDQRTEFTETIERLSGPSEPHVFGGPGGEDSDGDAIWAFHGSASYIVPNTATGLPMPLKVAVTDTAVGIMHTARIEDMQLESDRPGCIEIINKVYQIDARGVLYTEYSRYVNERGEPIEMPRKSAAEGLAAILQGAKMKFNQGRHRDIMSILQAANEGNRTEDL